MYCYIQEQSSADNTLATRGFYPKTKYLSACKSGSEILGTVAPVPIAHLQAVVVLV